MQGATMSQTTLLDLEHLHELDGGRVKLLFGRLLKTAGQDCWDRPAEKKPRVVTIKIGFTPQIDPQGNCEGVEFHVEGNVSTPRLRTKSLPAGLNKAGQMWFFSEEVPSLEEEES
jgi:hypothetical protein